MAGRDWKRLASFVVRARIERGLGSRAAFEVATGVSERTLGNLERGQSVRSSTLAAVESALGWTPGSADAVLAGGDPAVAGGGLQATVDAAYSVITTGTVDEFVARFRGAESVYLEHGDRAGADRWLRNALAAREEAIRSRATKRDAS